MPFRKRAPVAGDAVAGALSSRPPMERAQAGRAEGAGGTHPRGEAEPSSRVGRLVYLCLQATREGQASHAHVHEIVGGLRRRGWDVELREPAYATTAHRVGLHQRAWEFLAVQWRVCTGPAPDFLYIRSHPTTLPTALWARARRIPVVHEINGPYADLFLAYPWLRPLAPVWRWLIRTPLRLADALITVTPELKRWAADETGVAGESITVVPNGANTDRFRPRRHGEESERPSWVPGTPYVVFVGALAKWQGIGTLLKAVRSTEWPEDVHLVIAGDGAARAEVETAAQTDPRVVYLGRVPYGAVPELLRCSFAALSPQVDPDGRAAIGVSPVKLYEALACGVPVIVTDIAGQADLVRRHGCGLVVPMEDPGALAAAVGQLWADPARRSAMGSIGRTLMEQEHSWEIRAAATHAVLLNVVGRT
jgi:glycosyltransferase involved in cell wall biosynthesis